MIQGILVITHHFPPESVGGSTRINELIKILARVIGKYHRKQIIVLCPPATFPFGKYKRTKMLFKREDSTSLATIYRVWTFQPVYSKPTFNQRVLYYLMFPIVALPLYIPLMVGYRIKYVLTTTPPLTTLVLGFLAKFLGRKWIVDIRDLWLEVAIDLGYLGKKSMLYRIFKILRQLALFKCDVIISNSQAILLYISKLILNKEKLLYVPLIIDLDAFKPQKKNYAHVEHQIIYAGNLGSAQNLKILISAMEILATRNPDIKLLIIGGGEEEEVLKKMVQRLRLKNVIFLGKKSRDEIPDYLARSSIGIVALGAQKSLYYAIPTKLFEYMACGLPIIAYGASIEVHRILKKSNAGIYIGIGDPKKLADMIQDLIANKKLLNHMRINAKRFIRQHCDSSRIVNLLKRKIFT